MGLIGYMVQLMAESIWACYLHVVSHFLQCLYFSKYVFRTLLMEVETKACISKEERMNQFFLCHTFDISVCRVP